MEALILISIYNQKSHAALDPECIKLANNYLSSTKYKSKTPLQSFESWHCTFKGPRRAPRSNSKTMMGKSTRCIIGGYIAVGAAVLNSVSGRRSLDLRQLTTYRYHQPAGSSICGDRHRIHGWRTYIYARRGRRAGARPNQGAMSVT